VERDRKEGAESSQFSSSGVVSQSLADTRIGSGSDHTVFLNFIGMPVLGLGFEGNYGVYHSAYDDFFWMNRFGDPGYRYHTLMSQLWGVTALRLANADLLPFDFAPYASNIRQFVSDLARNNRSVIVSDAQNKSASSEAPNNNVILSGARSNERAESKDPVSPLDLTQVEKAIDNFEVAGKNLNESLTQKLAGRKIDPKLASELNHGMMQVERNWLNPDGIPGRPWFKHILYGARYTYAHLELPGLTEAVEKQDWPTAKQQAEILQHALEENTKLLDEMNGSLERY
jgi:N-acetylated-alpha-linked acidic dipeptidase